MEKRDIQIDVFARAKPECYSLIGEVKCRDSAKFSLAEAEWFLEKTRLLLEAEKVGQYVGFVFSVSGFAKDALEYIKEKKIAWGDNESSLEG